MTYRYKMKGTLDRPTHLFRYPLHGQCPDYLGQDGEWHPEPQLLRYAQDDPGGADDISAAEARRVANALRSPPAV